VIREGELNAEAQREDGQGKVRDGRGWREGIPSRLRVNMLDGSMEVTNCQYVSSFTALLFE
jgi:hypothetical protein